MCDYKRWLMRWEFKLSEQQAIALRLYILIIVLFSFFFFFFLFLFVFGFRFVVSYIRPSTRAMPMWELRCTQISFFVVTICVHSDAYGVPFIWRWTTFPYIHKCVQIFFSFSIARVAYSLIFFLAYWFVWKTRTINSIVVSFTPHWLLPFFGRWARVYGARRHSIHIYSVAGWWCALTCSGRIRSSVVMAAKCGYTLYTGDQRACERDNNWTGAISALQYCVTRVQLCVLVSERARVYVNVSGIIRAALLPKMHYTFLSVRMSFPFAHFIYRCAAKYLRIHFSTRLNAGNQCVLCLIGLRVCDEWQRTSTTADGTNGESNTTAGRTTLASVRFVCTQILDMC